MKIIMLCVMVFFCFSVCFADFAPYTCVQNKEGVGGVVVSRRIYDSYANNYWYIVKFPSGQEKSELEENLVDCACSKVDFNNFTVEDKEFLVERMSRKD